SCWSEELGYECCPSSKCTVYLNDDSGDWGIHNNQWCGIDHSICNDNKNNAIVDTNKESCWSEELGYECCPSSKCTVYLDDDNGDWGIHNNQWCGIDHLVCNNKEDNNHNSPDNPVEKPKIMIMIMKKLILKVK
ncbi:Non-catalytic module family DOC2, partial [Piromyces sp. E2]